MKTRERTVKSTVLRICPGKIPYQDRITGDNNIDELLFEDSNKKKSNPTFLDTERLPQQDKLLSPGYD